MIDRDGTDPGPAPRPGNEVPQGPRRSRGHTGVLAAAAFVAIGLTAAGTVLSPDPSGVGTHEQLGLPPCMTMELWGVPCPGCGVTTAVTLASHGRLADSFATQPFGLVLWLAGAAFVLASAIGAVAGVDLGGALRRVPGKRVVTITLVGAALAWIYKLVTLV